jgi:hypothetical protein
MAGNFPWCQPHMKPCRPDPEGRFVLPTAPQLRLNPQKARNGDVARIYPLDLGKPGASAVPIDLWSVRTHSVSVIKTNPLMSRTYRKKCLFWRPYAKLKYTVCAQRRLFWVSNLAVDEVTTGLWSLILRFFILRGTVAGLDVGLVWNHSPA